MMAEEHPPLSALVDSIRYWWRMIRWPIVLLAVNLVVMFSFVVDESVRWQSDIRVLQSIYRRKIAAYAVLSVIDSYILWRAVRLLEKEIIADDETTVRENEDAAPSVSSMSSNSNSNSHVRLSKSVDRFLGHSSSPTIFLSLLYALFVAAIVVSVVLSCLRLYMIDDQVTECIVGSTDRFNPLSSRNFNLTGVPDELHRWAVSAIAKGENVPLEVNNSIVYAPKPYSILKERSLWLPGPDPAKLQTKAHGEVLLHLASDSYSTQALPAAFQPRNFMDFWKNDRKGAPDSFCCLVNTVDEISSRSTYDNMQTVVCCGSDLASCRNQTLVTGMMDSQMKYLDKIPYGTACEAVPWKDTVWLCCQIYRDRSTEYYIHSLDPFTMNLTNVTSFVQEGMSALLIAQQKSCSRWLLWGLVLPGAAMLTASSWWLIKIKDVAVGVSPIAVAVYVILSSIDWTLGYYTAMVGVGVAAATLFAGPPTWLTRDMSLWIFYTLVTLLFVPLNRASSNALPWTVPCIVLVSVGLNHPILQVIGGAILALVGVGLPTLIFLPTATRKMTRDFFMYSPLILVVGIGLLTIGRVLKRYRAYGLFHLRRMSAAVLHPHRTATEESIPGESTTLLPMS